MTHHLGNTCAEDYPHAKKIGHRVLLTEAKASFFCGRGGKKGKMFVTDSVKNKHLSGPSSIAGSPQNQSIGTKDQKCQILWGNKQ